MIYQLAVGVSVDENRSSDIHTYIHIYIYIYVHNIVHVLYYYNNCYYKLILVQ